MPHRGKRGKRNSRHISPHRARWLINRENDRAKRRERLLCSALFGDLWEEEWKRRREVACEGNTTD